MKEKGTITTISGFELWQGALHASFPGSKMETRAITKMMELASTYSQWSALFYRFPKDSPEKLFILNKMAETAIEGNDWDNIYLCAPDDSELKQLAYEKMSELDSRYFQILNNKLEKGDPTFFKE